MKPYLITVCLICFATLLNPLSAQEEVDYASKFYEIYYFAPNDNYEIDSVEILDIYGNVKYKGTENDICLTENNTLLHIRENSKWVTYDASGKVVNENPFYNFVYSADSLEGLVDGNGHIVIPPIYKNIHYWPQFDDPLPQQLVVEGTDGMEGIISIHNDTLLPLEYKWVFLCKEYGIISKDNPEGTGREYQLRGLVCLDDKGKVSHHTDLFFDDTYFYDGWWGDEPPFYPLIPVKNVATGKSGYIDKNGKIVVPCKYDKVKRYSDENGFLYGLDLKDTLCDIFDNISGKKVFSGCEDFSWNGKDSEMLDVLLCMKNNSGYGVELKTGKIKYTITELEAIEGGYLNYTFIKKSGKYGVLNTTTGKEVVPCNYLWDKSNWMMFLKNKPKDKNSNINYAIYGNEEEHTIDFIRLKDGKTVRTLHGVKNFEWFYKGAGIITTLDGYFNICDETGKVIVGSEYKIKSRYSPRKISVRDYFIIVDSIGIFDFKGNILMRLSGDYSLDISSVDTAFKAVTCKNNKTNNYDYYVFQDGKFTRVDSYDAIYRYYYTQCQEKFRKQPSDVDKNIPETNTTNSNTYAFIIANEDYPSAPVPYGLNDGRSFKTYCEKTLGIPANHVYLYENATNGQLIACVEQIKKAAKAHEGDIDILFYYAGHAFPDEETKSAYLLPIDGDATISATGYSLDKLYGELGQLNVNSVVCFIDACFSGATRDDNSLLAGRAVIIKPKNSEPRGNTVVFTASESTETAHQYQAKKHGMFTYYLLKKLQESKGEVTLGELADYLNSNVKKMSFEVNNKLQTPKVLVSPAMELKWRTLKLND